MAAGAALNTRTNWGVSALDAATYAESSEVIAVLQKAGATGSGLGGSWRLNSTSSSAQGIGRVTMSAVVILTQTGSVLTGTLLQHALVGTFDGSTITLKDARPSGDVTYQGRIINGRIEGTIDYSNLTIKGTWAATRTAPWDTGSSETIGSP
jgi:hypothetical protein